MVVFVNGIGVFKDCQDVRFFHQINKVDNDTGHRMAKSQEVEDQMHIQIVLSNIVIVSVKIGETVKRKEITLVSMK